MLAGYKIVPFIPAGRKATMEILLDNLRRFGKVIDQVQVWVNTDEDQHEDNAWLASLPQIYGDWVRLIPRRPDYPVRHPKQYNTGGFYIYTTDPDTIYFRFDDDIVYVDDRYFENMVRFRLDNPQYFVVFGHIWHNATTSYLNQQVYHTIGTEHGVVGSPFCMDPVGWESGRFAAYLHEQLLGRVADGTVEDLFFDRYEIPQGVQFSVSNFCFLGSEWAKFGGELGPDTEEEGWITRERPAGQVNAICGSALVSHFSFFHHRQFLMQTDLLPRYRELARRLLEQNYYKLLGQS
jgi:hypothetical protein